MPVLRQLRNVLRYDTDDLMDQVEDFSSMVKELQDYSWRLTEQERAFLAVVQELAKRLMDDAALTVTTENVEYCQKEVAEALEKRIEATKERINYQVSGGDNGPLPFSGGVHREED
jgi:GTPase involved in cell partitioning and DNA repair